MDEIKMKGQWFITLYGPNGEIKAQKQGFNVVTTVGKEFIASLLYSCALAAATNTAK